jgi:hypothetical protein
MAGISDGWCQRWLVSAMAGVSLSIRAERVSVAMEIIDESASVTAARRRH